MLFGGLQSLERILNVFENIIHVHKFTFENVCVYTYVRMYVCMYVLMYDYIYVLFVCRV